MKRITLVAFMLSLAVAITLLAAISSDLPSIVSAQEKQPEHKLIGFHMALLKHGPSYNAAGMPKDLQAQHIRNVMTLLESGKAVIAGPLADESDIAGILIFRAKSADEARAWAENDPAVKAGFFTAEMHPWWSEDVMKPPTSPRSTNCHARFPPTPASVSSVHA